MNEGKPTAKEEFYMRCNNCGQCVAYCPTSSSMQSFSEGVALEQSLPFNPQLTETYLRFLKSRRSNRNYLEEPVEKQTIEKILDAANYAASGGNNRTLRWIVLDKRKKTDELRELIAEWFDTVCRAHPVYSKRYAIDSILERYRGGKDVILRGAPHVAYCVGPSNAVWGRSIRGLR